MKALSTLTAPGRLEPAEECSHCRFRVAEYTEQDLQRSLLHLDRWFSEFTYGLTEAQLNTPPSGTHGDAFCYETASIAELTQWCREQLQPTAPASESRLVMANDLHLAMHTLSAIARRRAELGLGSQAGSGTVSSIHTSGGGVPKSSIPQCRVGYRGLEGDRQNSRVHHGRVWQAVSLWSSEVIAALQAEGHPIGPGRAGENLTIEGLSWSDLLLGTQLRIGGPEGVLLELTDWATPCTKISNLFADGDSTRIDAHRHRGWSRAYAKVLVDGEIRLGDSVLIEDEIDDSSRP